MPLSVASREARLLRRGDLRGHSCRPTEDYWYRPGHLLVHRDDVEDGRRALEELGAEEVGLGEDLRHLPEFDPPVRRFRLPDDVLVPAAVERVRRTPGRRVRVTPVHVFGALPNHAFFPGSIPVATDERLDLPEPVEDAPVRVAVLDTGLVVERHRDHNPHVEAHERMALDVGRDDEPLDDEPTDGMLDDADAHGGFIADLIRHHAPEAKVVAARVLRGGLGDELQIADGLARVVLEVEPHVVNLSLGGYTDGDVKPYVLGNLIRKIGRSGPVLVAAAGNDGRYRPTWPAAFAEVIGVGAVYDPGARRMSTPPQPARFSNRGRWVDCCAVGVDVLSTYVEFDERAPRAGEPLTDPAPTPQQFTGWARWSGTSFAAPLVAARIAQRALELRAAQGLGSSDAVRAAVTGVLASAPVSVPGLGPFIP